MTTMKAAVIYTPGGPEALKLETRPIPIPKTDEVLIHIKAIGLNRSEMFTRRGDSGPAVRFPRILGIEAAGLVAACPNRELREGQVVAEYTVVKSANVKVLNTELPWEVVGSMPEMLQTAWGALFKSLRLKRGERLLVRGGTSSVGLAAAAIARNSGCFVASTTRRKDRAELLKEHGASEVFIDDGNIASQVGEKFDKVLELVGTVSMDDSLKCVKQGGSVCLAGILGNSWERQNFIPMASIPTAVNLTTYGGSVGDLMALPLEDLAQQIKEGKLKIKIGKVFQLDEIVEAHRCMENSEAEGKIVVLT
ncbi:hypothetical protein B7494_g3837 [Chlorociboria aeruginascens]|nr:hypothetical protein B7494_g3837 [Chlorociboria aeruginascens]